MLLSVLWSKMLCNLILVYYNSFILIFLSSNFPSGFVLFMVSHGVSILSGGGFGGFGIPQQSILLDSVNYGLSSCMIIWPSGA